MRDCGKRGTGEALENIEKDQYENLLLKAITTNASLEFRREFLQALLPVATSKSIDALRPLLKDAELSYMASWILNNLGIQD